MNNQSHKDLGDAGEEDSQSSNQTHILQLGVHVAEQSKWLIESVDAVWDHEDQQTHLDGCCWLALRHTCHQAYKLHDDMEHNGYNAGQLPNLVGSANPDPERLPGVHEP